MTNDDINLLVEQKPALERAREHFEAMQPGTYCMHHSWGFGQIKGYDRDENKLIIDFEERPGHKMDPSFCVDRLELLADDDIVVRRRTEPDAIEEMIKKQPGELVVQILGRSSNQTATTTELETILARVIGPTKFKKWWTATKKLLVKDPRVATPSKKTDPYVLREEPLKPEEEILEDFYTYKQPKKKILLAEKLYQISDNVEEIAADLPNIFDHLTKAIQTATGLSQGERLHGVWVRNDLARHLEEDPETIEPTSKGLLMEADDLDELADQIPNGYHKRFLDLISRTFPENEWPETVMGILKNSAGKMTSESISFMVERGYEDMVADAFRRWLDEQNIKGPVLLWIIKNRNSRKFKKLVEGLVGPRFLSAVLYAIDAESLNNATTKRIPLADILSDDAELIPDILEQATPEEARDLAQSLWMNQGFDELTKKSLLARFIKQFPNIQSLVDGGVTEKAEELIVSQPSFDRLMAEFDEIVKVKIPENKVAIEVAREHGDLKENSEYKMARQDQETLMARKAQLQRDLDRARVTDFSEAKPDVVSVGSIVKLKDDQGAEHEYAILGAWDSAPEQNILSYQTPLGQALLGKNSGTTVTTDINNNEVSWTIQDINRWVDSDRSLS